MDSALQGAFSAIHCEPTQRKLWSAPESGSTGALPVREARLAADLLSGADRGPRDPDRRDWNTKDEANGAVGYVTRFSVRTSFLANYEPQEAAGAISANWIPAEGRDSFNEAIVGSIEVIPEWRGQLPQRVR